MTKRQNVEQEVSTREIVLTHLNEGCMSMDELIKKSGLGLDQLGETLTSLVAEGYAIQFEGDTIAFGVTHFTDYIQMLETRIAELEAKLAAKPVAPATNSRKEQVLAFLANGAHISIADIAKSLGINNTNVSSVLSDLRKKDGLAIGTDSLGRKYIEGGLSQ